MAVLIAERSGKQSARSGIVDDSIRAMKRCACMSQQAVLCPVKRRMFRRRCLFYRLSTITVSFDVSLTESSKHHGQQQHNFLFSASPCESSKDVASKNHLVFVHLLTTVIGRLNRSKTLLAPTAECRYLKPLFFRSGSWFLSWNFEIFSFGV
jgi:hypothetical protein